MENIYTGIPDDFKPNYLTIEEMREIAEQDAYKRQWEAEKNEYGYVPIYQDEKTKLTYCDRWNYRVSTVHKHILVEEYMASDFDSVDWEFVTNKYDLRTIADIILLFQHPLVWDDHTCEPFGMIIYGRMAHAVSHYEEYDGRGGTSYAWLLKILNKAALYFADHLPTYNKDDLSKGIKTGMHRWGYIMVRREEMENYIAYEYDDFKSFNNGFIFFDPDALLKNIRYIKEQRGVAKAAEIVKLFQTEWEDIEILDAYKFSKYPTQQIAKFRKLLFKGFNRDLGLSTSGQNKAGGTTYIMGDYIAGNKYVNTDGKQ